LVLLSWTTVLPGYNEQNPGYNEQFKLKKTFLLLFSVKSQFF
jgi:hypothetical protein